VYSFCFVLLRCGMQNGMLHGCLLFSSKSSLKTF
jgi:hypothetical protein